MTPESKDNGIYTTSVNVDESHGDMRVQRQNPYFGARPHFILRKINEESRMR